MFAPLCKLNDRSKKKKNKNVIIMVLVICSNDDIQSVENAGVAFVKEANERNEFFDTINKQ